MPTELSSDTNVPRLTRTCPHPGHEGERTLPFNAENFYIRPNGTADYWCRACVRTNARAARLARTANGRKFGVEIEFIGSRYELEEALRAEGLEVLDTGYTHRVMRVWKIVPDGSLNHGCELVSPPLKGAGGFAELKLACEALKAAGCTVNQSCGLHVHHDVTNLNTRSFGRLFRAWYVNQRNTDMLVARSRRGSQWAAALREDEVALAEALPSVDPETARSHFGCPNRYRSLNVASFPRFGTVEIRQRQGTLAFDKIAAWIAFGQSFIKLAQSSAHLVPPADTFALIDLLAGHGLSVEHADFLRGRATHFTGRVPVAA